MADITVARPGAAAPVHPARMGAWLVASTGMMLALLAPALWNGFPLIFPDTGGYLTRPIEGVLALGRSALYGWFLYLNIPLAFWPVIVAQAAVTAWVIVLTLRCHGLGGRPWLALGLTVALSLLTALPWFAAQLMPDILFPLAILAVHLLAFRTAELNVAERCGLGALIAVAIASHMAALALCLGVLVALWLLDFIKPLGLPPLRLREAAIAVVGGIALCLASNAAITGAARFTPGGTSFLFGRLIEYGVAQRYLNEHCPNPALRLCAYAQQMPISADDWLWANDTPFYKLGGVDGFEPEEKRIIVETLKLYPMMHLRTALAATLDQLTSFATEISIDDNDPTFDAIRDYAPQLLPAYQAARQQAQRFDVGPLNLLHVPAAALAIAGLVVALAVRRRLKIAPEFVALCTVVLVTLIVNAVICGVFSHPVDRYQSRVVMLAPLALMLLVAYRRRREHPRLEAGAA
ncbi:hypothetical protein MXD81_58130 [Microbacteriaceae bacterium K1510]|nr:hypothetical protein [Microbacteriaceae bacterium K1510]